MEYLCVNHSTLFSLCIKFHPFNQDLSTSAMFFLPFNRVLESHFQSQKEIYEKEIEGLNFKVEHLSQDINHLQKLFREENDINDGIRLEVSRLTSENLVCSRCRSTTQICLWHSKSWGHVFDIARLRQAGPCKVAHPWDLFPACWGSV